MSQFEDAHQDTLDEAIEATKDESLSVEETEEIAGRVRRRLFGEEASHAPGSFIRGCEDVRALLPQFLEHGLSEGQTLLLEDHLRECVVCRRAWRREKQETTEQSPFERAASRSSFSWVKWGSLAASFLMVALLVQWAFWNGLVPGFTSEAATLEHLDGQMFRIDQGRLMPLAQGDEVSAGQVLRTGKNSGAVLRLEDGSSVELAGRTELSLARDWKGRLVRLDRGQVIVEAADQGDGRLFVSTGECRVAVKGTVFSVSHGMKGSRVSVIEGEVWVEQSGEDVVLGPGQQYASNATLSQISLKEEFLWSRRAPQHLAVLEDLSALQRSLLEASFGENLRYSSDLVGLLPADTLVYGALPNISGNLEEVYQQFRERMAESPALQEFLHEDPETTGDLEALDTLIGHFGAVGEKIGEEIVVALVASDSGGGVVPVCLAQALDPVALKSLVESQIASMGDPEVGRRVVIVESLAGPQPEETELVVLIQGELLGISPSWELLRQVTGMDPTPSLVSTDFFETIAGSYGDGVDWLFALDVSSLLKAGEGTAASESEIPEGLALSQLGIGEVASLVIERKRRADEVENHAVLSYEPAGRGLLSWIALPGPMGALDFVSPDAYLAAAFVVADPVELVDDVLSSLQERDPEQWERIRRFEAEHGISIRQDLAAPLGGEGVFAFDGPVLPSPAWKLVVEVYDAAALQRTLEWMISEFNAMVPEEGRPPAHLSVTALNGAGLYELSVQSDDSSTSFYYRYVDGYMVIAPDPTLIEQAVQFRATGYSLSRSSRFAGLLPQGASVNVSGVLYHNLAPLLQPLLSSGLADASGSAEVQRLVESLLGDTRPSLISLYSEPGRLEVASAGDLDSLWVDLGTLGFMGGPEGLAGLIDSMEPDSSTLR